jgi:hypothetical protein
MRPSTERKPGKKRHIVGKKSARIEKRLGSRSSAVELEEHRARIAQLMAPPNPMMGQESRDTNKVDQLTGEEHSLVQTVLQKHLVIAKKYVIQIFKSSFNPINLPRIYRSGADPS